MPKISLKSCRMGRIKFRIGSLFFMFCNTMPMRMLKKMTAGTFPCAMAVKIFEGRKISTKEVAGAASRIFGSKSGDESKCGSMSGSRVRAAAPIPMVPKMASPPFLRSAMRDVRFMPPKIPVISKMRYGRRVSE